MNSRNKHSNQLSREDVIKYTSTDDERIKHSIERNSSLDNFDNDALEGWSEHPNAFPHLKKTDAKFGTTSKLLLITTVIGVLIAIGTFILLSDFSTPEKPITANDETVRLTIEQSDIVLPESIDSMQSLPNPQLIKPKAIQKEFKQKESTPETRKLTQNNNESDIKVSDLPLIKIDQPQKPSVTINNTAKEIYVSDLKLVDYRQYRNRPVIPTKTFVLSGVPANQESSERTSAETEMSTLEIPYYDYIKKTQAQFAKENYKGALTRYLTILETYPDDLNALFYSGLCYYNLKQYSSASQQFYECTIGKYNNFNEEAEWYLAKSYSSLGEYEKANAIYELIISKNGYYAQQAKKLITK